MQSHDPARAKQQSEIDSRYQYRLIAEENTPLAARTAEIYTCSCAAVTGERQPSQDDLAFLGDGWAHWNAPNL
jgi:hypothetical protein